MLLAAAAACNPFESESADQTEVPPTASAVAQEERSPVATAEATTAAVATETPAPPKVSPTPSPETAPPVPTETPTPSLAPEPTSAVHLYIPTAGVDDATPTAAARAEPTPQDLLAERLRQFVQEGIRKEFPDAEAQPVHVFPLGLSDATGDFWGAVTDGPQPARITADDEAVNFFHFAAVYRLAEGDVWTEVDRLEIETAPQRPLVDLTPTGWALPNGVPAAWITVRGGTGAHAGTLDIIRFDGETLRTELSWLSSGPTRARLRTWTATGR